MQFDGPFGGAEAGPGEDGETQVNGGGIEGVDGLLECQTKVLVEIQLPSRMNQGLCEVGVDAPVAGLIGVGQGIA